MNKLKIRLLTALLTLSEPETGVTHIASLFGLSKSTVSRAVQELAEEGLVIKSERTLRLTGTGQRLAADYERQFGQLLAYLRGLGIPPEQAVQDSYTLLLAVSPETRAAIVGAAKPIGAARSDGVYDLSFAIYHTKAKGVRSLSMANDAFRHPAQLVMRNGRGVIRLESLPVRHPSAFHDQVMSGTLGQMSYQKGAQFHQCLREGQTVCIPLDSLQLSDVPEHGLTLGEVVIRIIPNLDERHMPERTALFTAYL